MADKYTVKEVSELFGISKSKLRFWEKKGIIHAHRNDENDYREYTKAELLKISDILFYRFNNYSINSLKNIENLSIEQNECLLKELYEQILDKKNELAETEQRVLMELENIKLLKDMKKGQFKVVSPDFKQIRHLHIHYKENIMKYTDNHHMLASVLDKHDIEVKHFGVICFDDEVFLGEKLWDITENNCTYLPFLLKVEERKLDFSNFKEVYNEDLNNNQFGRIIARFIMNDQKYAYYQAWIEKK